MSSSKATFLVLAATQNRLAADHLANGASLFFVTSAGQLPVLVPIPQGVVVRSDVNQSLFDVLRTEVRMRYPGAWLIREASGDQRIANKGCDLVVPTLELGLRVLESLCVVPSAPSRDGSGPAPGHGGPEPLGWFRTDISGRVLWSSPGVAPMLQWEPGVLRSLWAAVEPVSGGYDAMRWLEMFRSGGDITLQVQVKHGAFASMGFLLRASAIRDDAGTVGGISGTLSSLPLRPSTIDTLGAGLRAVIDFLGDPTIVARGPDALIAAISASAEGFLRVDATRLLGRPLVSLHANLALMIEGSRNVSGPILEISSAKWTSRDGPLVAEARVCRTSVGPTAEDLWWIIEYPEASKHEEKQELRRIAKIMASPGEGQVLLQSLVVGLAQHLGTANAIICEVDDHRADWARLLACAQAQPDCLHEFPLVGTASGRVLQRRFICVARDLGAEFPDSELVQKFGYQSYMGVVLNDETGAPMGVLAVLDDKPMRQIKALRSILLLFRVRVETELVRIRRLAVLQKRAIMLADVQRIVGVGGWEYAPAKDEMRLEPFLAQALGLDGRTVWAAAEFFGEPSLVRFREHLRASRHGPPASRLPIRLLTRTSPRPVQVMLMAGSHHVEAGATIVRGAMSNADALRTEQEHWKILFQQIEVMLKNAPILFIWTGADGVAKYCAGGSFPDGTRRAADFFGKPVSTMLKTAAERRGAAQLVPGKSAHFTVETEVGRIFNVWANPMFGDEGAPDGHLCMAIEQSGLVTGGVEGRSEAAARRLAASLGDIGFWEWQPDNDAMIWSPESLGILGWSPSQAPATGADLERALGTGLREVLRNALADHELHHFTHTTDREGSGPSRFTHALIATGGATHQSTRILGAVRRVNGVVSSDGFHS